MENKNNILSQSRTFKNSQSISKFNQTIQYQNLVTNHQNSKLRLFDNASLSYPKKKRKKRQANQCRRRRCNMVRNFYQFKNHKYNTVTVS